MLIKDVCQYLEGLAPKSTSESYDNVGLLVGDANKEATSALVCLDITEEVLDEALSSNCNLIIAHHPIIFKGLKSLTGKNLVERCVIKAIKHDIAIYAIHTNLDNYRFGVNHHLAEVLGLEQTKILSPTKGSLNKLSVFVPVGHENQLAEAVYKAGAGKIGNYDRCSYKTKGEGTFRPIDGAKPFAGETGEDSLTEETKMEFLVEDARLGKVLSTMWNAHPYEEVAHDVYPLKNVNAFEGAGMIGILRNPMDEKDFLRLVKEKLNCGVIRYTNLLNRKIGKVAICGGSGSFLLQQAKNAGADVFITGDFKYHEFFDAENEIMIMDVGHYESEQYTSDLLVEILMKKFATFAVRKSRVNTNPVNYF